MKGFEKTSSLISEAEAVVTGKGGERRGERRGEEGRPQQYSKVK